MSKNKLIKKDDVVQAVVIADNFGPEFLPFSTNIPLALLPLVNKPLIDYTLEFLSLGGVEETFLFCCTHVEAIKQHINNLIQESTGWSLTMKVNIIISESCYSFGDCLRDIDAKGLIRGNFVLVEAGAISNIKLLPILRNHEKLIKKDKGAAMTFILQEIGLGQNARCPLDEMVLAVNDNNRVLFQNKFLTKEKKKIHFPLEIFLDNPLVSLLYNIKDTHISICSPAVLPLFSDNFDFQTKDDFVKGLLINEEILGSTVYYHLLKGSQYGGAVTNFKMFQAISWELQNKWLYPLLPLYKNLNKSIKQDVIIGVNTNIASESNIKRSIIGENVKFAHHAHIDNTIIFSNCKIGDNVIITNSILGFNCDIKSKTKISSCILDNGVIIENGKNIESLFVQATPPENCKNRDKLGKKAFKLNLIENESENDCNLALLKHLSHLQIDDDKEDESDNESDAFRDSEDDDDNLSNTHSPLPDDTKLFFAEVIDSLTRGFEDELQCDNLILEINSSRYAYNITLKEVNFNVVKAILHLSLNFPNGSQYFSQFLRSLSYFSPILKNYIRNDSSMLDCLQALEHVAISNEKINEKWVMFVLKWLYDKDHISEDVILKWFNNLDKKFKFYSQVKMFATWLQEAEEASSSDDDYNLY